MDEASLGRAVDAWLTALRTQGLSSRRLQRIASLLGEAMSLEGPQTPTQVRVLQQFETWLQAHWRIVP